MTQLNLHAPREMQARAEAASIDQLANVGYIMNHGTAETAIKFANISRVYGSC